MVSAAVKQESGEKTSAPKKTAMEKVTAYLCQALSFPFICRDRGGGGAVLPCRGYIGMCGPKRYGFSPVLVINRASISAILSPFW